MIRTADDLLTSIKSEISIPSQQSRYTDTALLAMADNYISSELVPMIISMKIDLLTRRETVTVTGAYSYPIPSRAVARSLRSVKYNKITLQHVDFIDWFAEDGTPTALALCGDEYYPWPTPTSGTLEIAYQCRPSQLAKLTACGVVTGLNAISKIIQVSTVPTGVTTGSLIDVIQGKQGNRIRGSDLSVTVSGTNLELGADIPDGTVLGDYVALAEYSPVLQFPLELADLVSLAVQKRVLMAQSDDGAAAKEAEYKEALKNARAVLSPRLEGAPQLIGPSPLVNRFPRNWRRLCPIS